MIPYTFITFCEIVGGIAIYLTLTGHISTHRKQRPYIPKSIKIKTGQQTTLIIRYIFEKPKPVFWKCPYCNTQNEIDRDKCLNCGSPRRMDKPL